MTITESRCNGAELAHTVIGRVSIVVPTRNSARTIEACLRAARRQTHRDVEVVVVDNGSCDETLDIARGLADRIEECGPERSAQRNRGAAVATGEILVFVDSDQTLSPEVAHQAATVFGEQPALGVLVIPELSHGVGFLAACRALEKRLYLGDRTAEAGRAFRRVAFEAVEGYDESLTAPEDYDVADRVEASGWTLGRIDATVWHDDGRVRLRDVYRKKRYYGRCLPSFFSTASARRRRLARPGLLNRPGLLIRDPLHAFGLAALKATDALGLGSGAVASRRHGRDADREPAKGVSGAAPDAWDATMADRYATDHPQLQARASSTALLDVALAADPGGIVDVGCGEGGTLSLIRSRLPDAAVVGCDISRKRAGRASRDGHTAMVANGVHLPVVEDGCGLVISRHVIEHVDDVAVLTEASRVLRPEGMLYLETPLRLRGAWFPYRNQYGRHVLDPTHVREYSSQAELERLVSAAGFCVLGSDIAPIRYPLGHVVVRVLRPGQRPAHGLTGSLARIPGWIRVPRYREIRLLAIKEQPVSGRS